MLAAKTCYKGESLQNRAIAFKPITFPGQKKRRNVVLVVVCFLSCDKFPADPGTLPMVLLPARGLRWVSGKYFILS